MIKSQEQLDNLVKEIVRQFHISTMCVGVYQKGNTFFSCHGKSQQGKADIETIFPIGSASKAFIATTILQLCKEGKLDLDTPIIEYLPDFAMYTSDSTQQLTLRDALCHRSGLPRHDITLFTNQDTPLAKMVDQIRYLEPAFPLRTRFCYQNHMFGLASLLVEKASGLFWGDYLQQEIFDKLGMERTYTRSQEYEQKDTNYAKPKIGTGILNLPTKNLRCDSTGGAGSISSCVVDMLHWAQMNLQAGQYDNQTIFEKEAASELHQAQMPIRQGEMSSYEIPEITDTAYGLGWFTENFHGEKYIHHGGSITGFKSAVGFMPSQDLAFCILTNRNNTQATCALEYTLCDAAMEAEDGNWIPKFLAVERHNVKKAKKKYTTLLETKTKQPLEKNLTGFYSHPAYGKLQVFLKGNQLKVKLADFTLSISSSSSGECILYSSLLGIGFPCRFETNENGVPCLFIKLEEMINDYICFQKTAP